MYVHKIYKRVIFRANDRVQKQWRCNRYSKKRLQIHRSSWTVTRQSNLLRCDNWYRTFINGRTGNDFAKRSWSVYRLFVLAVHFIPLLKWSRLASRKCNEKCNCKKQVIHFQSDRLVIKRYLDMNYVYGILKFLKSLSNFHSRRFFLIFILEKVLLLAGIYGRFLYLKQS